MNNISIHIDSLGPIRNADIDIRPLMIFTGESGLGKSYLACLANYTYALLSKGNGRLMDYFSEVDFSTLLDGKSQAMSYSLLPHPTFSIGLTEMQSITSDI